ncbi:MAG: MFS transporter [Salinirussus sp.]
MSAPEAATTAEAAVPGPSRRRSLATVLGIVFLDLLGFGIIIPILPFYVRSFGVSDVFIGLLAAAYSAMQFGFAPLLGRVSDERGRRPVLALSLAGSAVAWVVFGLGAELRPSLGVVGALAAIFAARMLAGAMGGNIATAQAYVTDITPTGDRANALGLVGAMFSLGFVFGPALGAVVASDAVVTAARSVLPAIVPATAFSLPSFLAAGMSFLALIATLVLLPEPDRQRQRTHRRGVVAQFRAALADAALRPLVIVFLVFSIAFSGVTVAFVPFVADVYGFDAAAAGFLLTYIGVLGALNQGVLVRILTRRYRAIQLAIGGAVVLVAALVVLPLAPIIGAALPTALGPLVGLLVALAVLSAGNGLLSVGMTTLVSAAAGENEQGGAFGVTQGAGSLGRTIGPPVMTAIYVLAVWAPFLLAAVLTIGVVMLLHGIGRRVAT